MQVFSATILIIKIICVFPNIKCHNRLQSFGNRVLGVASLGDIEVTLIVGAKPHPSGTEKRCSGLFEFLFERIEASESQFDLFEKQSSGLFLTCRSELEEIEDMVPSLRSLIVKLPFALGNNFLKAHVGIFSSLHKRVKRVDLCFFMLSIVEINCGRRYHRIEGVD